MTLVVRAAGPDDATAMGAIRVAGWQAAYGSLLPPGALDDMDPVADAERVRGLLADGAATALVAERDSEVVGFCRYGPCRDDDRAGVDEIYAIYARPDRWSTGVGRALMGGALDRLGRPVVLWVLQDNPRARRFYDVAGFVADGTAKPITVAGTELVEIRYRLD